MPIDRMLRAAKLEAALYNEVKADATATTQALLVVIIVGVAAGIGSFLVGGGPTGLFSAVVTQLIGWVIGSALFWVIGGKLLGGTGTFTEVLRAVGFASSPGVLGIIPVVGGLVGGIWSLVAVVIAVRQALALSTGKAVVTVLIPAAVVFALVIVVGGLATMAALATLGTP